MSLDGRPFRGYPNRVRLSLLLILLSALAPAGAGAADTILVVGDSHTAGSFGQKLDDDLRAGPGNRVATYGVCSARPASYFADAPHSCGFLFRGFDKKAPAKWLGGRVYKERRPDGEGGTKEVELVKTPELTQLLSDHTPTLTVVALGANIPVSLDSVVKTLDAIHAAGSACLWIGPPYIRKTPDAQIDAVYATLRKAGVVKSASHEGSRWSSCRLVDSRAFSYLRYPAAGGDGMHYGGALAPLGSRWGDDAAAAIAAFTP